MQKRAHFLTTIGIGLTGILMVFQESMAARALLLVPLLVLQHIAFIFFSKEYDALMVMQWKKKESRIKEADSKIKEGEQKVPEKKEDWEEVQKRRDFTGRSRGRVQRISELY